MTLKLIQSHAESTHSWWCKISDGLHQCGNVRIIKKVRAANPQPYFNWEWRIEVRNSKGQWIEKIPKSRPWGYATIAGAKRGAALMAAWQRGVNFHPNWPS